ncbi:uncharacterized protein LOC110745592 isoform X1 [Prunus avium]|uniref:Uncharacterized protein LOC110745592 isoform X1 n=1 Tax=Prunus avium TaxID=42229 RepID=A0A6P5RHM1_PRUAV|nr:uncharacterized protein LOC110745592 isoform X1 [Prunus avium]
MAFFDLSIPYTDPSPPDRSSITRAKLVTKALELGYSGVAYNRMIKGVMSDRDRCSIPLLTIASFLKHSPLLLSNVNFHRDLLGLPRASPFRQYTRLTVCTETPAQSQALNSGNPILKTYDLVAAKPLNQSAFELACEKLEVDIIAIDFSDKLPFRLKMPMVKAAIERGVYFEITYANIIADDQARKQIITNAKLLVDWTRGRNLIVSSAAPTANEFRGPYDVANLMSLLGLSMERAKMAISRNCRTIISNAMRKKHFFKEAIRVEVVSSGQEIDTNKPWSIDSFKWDPISSGNGDILLDDLAKSFTTSINKVTKTTKAIDFASVIDSMPSLGFQVKDLISGSGVVASQSMGTFKSIVSASEAIEQSVVTAGVPEQPARLCFPQSGQTSLGDSLLEQQMFDCQNPQKSYSSSDTTNAFIDAMEIEAPTITTEAKPKNSDGTDGNFDLITTEIHDFQPQKCVTNRELNVVPANDNLSFHTLEIGLDAACNANSEVEISTNYQDTDIPAPDNEEAKCVKGSDTQSDLMDEILTVVDVGSKEEKSLPLNSSSLPTSENEQFRESGDDAVILANQVPVLESNDDMTIIGDYSVATHPSAEVKMEGEEHGKADTEMNDLALIQSIPDDAGKSRPKRKTPYQAKTVPLKRLLHTIPFKKTRKSKRKIKMA